MDRGAWFACVLLVVAAAGNEIITVPDMGRRLSIGDLYDARTHKVVNGKLWPDAAVQRALITKPIHYSEFSFARGDTAKIKATLLETGLDFSLSILGGVVKVDGSFKFVFDRKKTSKAIRMSIKNTMKTVKETVNVFDGNLSASANAQFYDSDIATHVVSGVSWGANTVATFESDYADNYERDLFKFYLRIKVLFGSTKVSKQSSSEDFEVLTDTTKVKMHGDIVPPESDFPTDPEGALNFMKGLHRISLENGKGIPYTIELTPLSWLDSKAAKFQRRIVDEMAEKAMDVYEALDRSEELINELLQANYQGFVAWYESVRTYNKRFLEKRSQLAQVITSTVEEVRSGVKNINDLVPILDDYYQSPISETAVMQVVQEKRDQLENLLALVEQLKLFDVNMAESFADLESPTFTSKYDRVYVLVLVGLVPSADRDGLRKVRDFTDLAEARMTSASGDPNVKHCLLRTRNGQTTCVEKQKFVIVHFDSFCGDICPSKYCPSSETKVACPTPPASEGCLVSQETMDRLQCLERPTCDTSNAAQRDSNDKPFSECWCSCPRTQVLEYVKSKSPVRLVDAMPTVPSQPTIIAVNGAADEEQDENNQRVIVELGTLSIGDVVSYKVRVVWLEGKKVGTEVKWGQRERIVSTADNSLTIDIPELVAGRQYRFEVAGVNNVGVGTYSLPFPASDYLVVAHNFATVIPSKPTSHGTPPKNKIPGWRDFNGTGEVPIMVSLSTPAVEIISQISFFSKGGALIFHCEKMQGATDTLAFCTVPVKQHPVASNTKADIKVYGKNGDVLGYGEVTFEAPDHLPCAEWDSDRALLCGTYITSVSGAQTVEGEPLHQVVTVGLSSSHLHTRLSKYRVRVSWRDPGDATLQTRVFATRSPDATFLVGRLAGGKRYQFEIAGIDNQGKQGPFKAPYPDEPLLIAHNMVTVTPTEKTNHVETPKNQLPVWRWETNGVLPVEVVLSARADEPIGVVTFGTVECIDYDEASTTRVMCNVPLTKLMGTQSDNLPVNVYSINNELLAWHTVDILRPSADNCQLWESEAKKHCKIVSKNVDRCVETCDDCTYNDLVTTEFRGACLENVCQGINIWCPHISKCIQRVAGAPEEGCTTFCSPDTIFNSTRNLCAVPCEFHRLPGIKVPPGLTEQLQCPLGSIWNGVEVAVGFTCPADNQEREEFDPEANKWARWSPPRDLFPDCIKCTNSDHCNGHAAEVSSDPSRTSCLCRCSEGYTGDKCDRCMPGYIDFPVCTKCAVSFHCNGNAHSVSPDSLQSKCVCQCKDGFTGGRCEQCAKGYLGYPDCATCSTARHCNGHAVTAVPRSDQAGCLCTCRTNFMGEECDKCAPGYILYPFCIRCSNSWTCHGNAEEVGTDENQRCVCKCKTGYTGKYCDRCATGYGNYPSCTDRWEEPGSVCSNGGRVTQVKWEPRKCGFLEESCITADTWLDRGDVPTCRYRARSFLFSFDFSCHASRISRVVCD